MTLMIVMRISNSYKRKRIKPAIKVRKNFIFSLNTIDWEIEKPSFKQEIINWKKKRKHVQIWNSWLFFQPSKECLANMHQQTKCKTRKWDGGEVSLYRLFRRLPNWTIFDQRITSYATEHLFSFLSFEILFYL